MMQSVVFGVVLTFTAILAYKRYAKIWRNIHLGKEERIAGNSAQRIKNVLLIAFGQKKMFKRWIPAIFHFFIYAAFLFTQIELIEIIVDGFSGRHRIFAPLLGGVYTAGVGLIEILSALAFLATIIFIVRRVVLKLPRFHTAEMKGWPFRDALYILLGELLLLIGIFSMNGSDVLLQQLNPHHYVDTGTLPISSWLGPMLFSGIEEQGLMIVERIGWWMHILIVFGFILYLPSSKHLHILLAFPNVYYSHLGPRGEMKNMPEVMKEVQSMLGLVEEVEPDSGELPEFGANDVMGLSWKTLLDAYTCTECGRCTSVCPAHITGKKLSPRKIMMDIRDRSDEIGQKLESGSAEFIMQGTEDTKLTKENFIDDKSLFDYISREEIHACTTCQACVEACPVMINPLEPILEMRRYEILTESAGPSDWIPMFTSLENSGSVWQIPEERAAWTKSETAIGHPPDVTSIDSIDNPV